MAFISSLRDFISSLIPIYSSPSASSSSSSSYASASASSSSPSSSSSTPSWNYDVFLSFRGEDTRYGFTDHLHSSLLRKGIRTFRDDKLKRGEEIAPELLKAIEESRFSMIVFSENYAHSRWCLDELVKIMECKKDLGQTVFPIFYHVDPSHVRKQTGSFGKAFANYEKNWKHKAQGWRRALTEAADLSGWHLIDGYESEDIKKISDNIFRRLNRKKLIVDDNLVGIDFRVKEVISRLHMESNDFHVVGIFGIGGMGKTTIAKVVYNKLLGEFEYMSFLENIREVSINAQCLLPLQNQFLSDILEEEGSQNITNVNHGASMIKTTLRSKKVLVVLDNVDDLDQLEYLLRNLDWLGKGSRVIITTRNKHLLTVQGVENLYEVEKLDSKEAYKLFCLNAFKQNLPKSEFESLVDCMVSYCQGLPLALKVVGSLLFQKTIPQWKSELSKLKRVPAQKIQKVLQISFEGLDHTERNIFLDIACFFKGEDKDCVSRILDGCNFYAERGIKNLMDKCLITIRYNQIHMHDLIQQMGWEVVRGEFPCEPEKWSRLWDPHDIERAFTTYKGIKGVETISLDLHKLERVHFNSNSFAKMTRLRLLKVYSSINILGDDCLIDYKAIEENYNAVMKDVSKMQFSQDFEFSSDQLRYLCWVGYPFDFLPSNLVLKNIVELHLQCSNIKQLWQGNKGLDLNFSKKLIQMPEFSSMPNLEELFLQGCVSLIEIHPSIGVLKKLKTLRLKSCDKLKGFPSSIELESLEILDLSYCSSFDKFPEIQGNMGCLKELYLTGTAIKELPNSIGNLESLEILYLYGCSSFDKFPEIQGNMRCLRHLDLSATAIKELPNSIVNLESLEILDLTRCSSFDKFPEIQGNMGCLRRLGLSGTAIKELPNSIGNLESLERLDLSDCSSFDKFPEIQGNMGCLRTLDLSGTAIKELPNSIGNLESLRYLFLQWSAIERLPSSIYNLNRLELLDLEECKITRSVPSSISGLESLIELHLHGCTSLTHLNLSGCNLVEGSIPSYIWCLYSLKILTLSGNNISSIPAGINQLCNLKRLDISHCKMLRKIPELPSSLIEIDAHDCTSVEDLSRLLWSWVKSTTQGLVCLMFSASIPESSGIPEWTMYPGSQIAIELPMNWYEDGNFLGFVVPCLFHPNSKVGRVDVAVQAFGLDFVRSGPCICRIINGVEDQLWVWWYPKMAIPKKYHQNKLRHFKFSFTESSCIKKIGVNLIFGGDHQRNHMAIMGEKSGDNRSIVEDTNGNLKRSRHDSAPKEEPQHKRLRAPNTDFTL